MKLSAILTLTQLVNAASETIKVELGKRLRISCDYSGVYVELSRETNEANRRRSSTSILMIRIEDKDVTMITTNERNWKFNEALSRYSADSNKSKLVTELAKAKFSDEGVYYCKDVTKKIINTINIVVISKPVVSSLFVDDLAVESGSTQFYVGKCSAREAKPAVSITWEDDKGRALTAIEKTTRAGLTAETSSELRIDTVRRNEHQQRRFRCKISQDGDVVFSSPLSNELNVEFLPEITAITMFSKNSNDVVPVKSNFTHSVGSTVRFFCASSGNPLPTVSWSVQNKTASEYAHWTEEITETGKFLIAEAEGRVSRTYLSTTSLKKSDEELHFTCSTANRHGSVTSDYVQLLVEDVPNATGALGLLWALVGVIGVVMIVALCMLFNRWIQQRRSGIYKTETLKEEDVPSLSDVSKNNKEYFM
ncbi:unnamed protein product [Oikopleura dioica]|uniref:Ig-like domain-containing protein n=1 Tax=Oikopleura dioica TaxID=34765 RepID=E4XWQ5_OIKDI|nr:unnamed protein product [Oikopleura dioica]